MAIRVFLGHEAYHLAASKSIPGLFEGHFKDITPHGPYSYEVVYANQAKFRHWDPYTFLPTLGDLDLLLIGEGRHWRLWERLGANLRHHQGVDGTAFAVWAPNAEAASVVGDFNSWDGRLHQMRRLGSSGIWEIFIPEVGSGAHYKFELRIPGKDVRILKSDPLSTWAEDASGTASRIYDLRRYQWGDNAYRSARRPDPRHAAISIYELHVGSWMHENGRPMTYRELAPRLVEHCQRLGFTHVEFMPIAAHPFGGSWGYQVTSYYAPTARYGEPDDLRFLIDTLHQANLGVIVDWVPGHFPKDDWSLAQFDGTSLYEHADPRQGHHPDWGTLIFNYGRNEVRNFLVANALFWIEEYHIDGLRVDAVASMLYLDYSRREGDWIPNRYGGRENEEALGFLRELNHILHERAPSALVIAEESTSWPRVSGRVQDGGLGFTFKWNMGWMHDVIDYFQRDPVYRKSHHHQLTFGSMYATSEQFVLPLSHDEVVHGKRSLLEKMSGDEWQKFANLRALYGWMWGFPGKKLLFMGGEFAQRGEWNHDVSLDWHLLADPRHARMQDLIAELNRIYRAEGALHDADSWPCGHQWIQANSSDVNVYALIRRGRANFREVVVIANLSPVIRDNYQIGVPSGGLWTELVNTDAERFGGSGVTNPPLRAYAESRDGQPAHISIRLPPLAVVWLATGTPPST